MKIVKSIVLSAVATLIVATGPEVAAPLVGGTITAEAAKPAPKCKRGYVLSTKTRAIKKSNKTLTTNRCRKVAVKKVKACKKGASMKAMQVKLSNGTTVTRNRCVKGKPKPAIKCAAPRVVRAKGTVIGKNPTTGAPILAKANSCVIKKV